jgi:hypothetical protein
MTAAEIKKGWIEWEQQDDSRLGGLTEIFK